jgi:hypothetical protein
MIGDEMAYPFVYRQHVKGLIDDGLQADVPLDQIIDEVRQRYHLYYVIPGGAAHGGDSDVIRLWSHKLGDQHVIHHEDANDTSESIALTIGASEGVVSPDQGVDQLRSRRGGVVSRTIDRLAHTLQAVFGRAHDTSSAAAAKRRL